MHNILDQDFKNLPGIYIFTNKINGKVYVGKANNIKVRMYKYRYINPKCNRPFSKAIRKYGWNSFYMEVDYHEDITLSELLELESAIINEYESLISQHGYNCCGYSTDCTGIIRGPQSIEHKNKRSLSMKGKKLSDKHKTNISNAFTSDRRNKLRDEKIGSNLSVETRLKMSESSKGIKNSMFGKTGDLHPISKIVLQLDNDGNILNEWKGITNVSKTLGINKEGISRCCRGILSSSGGYKWKYKD